MATETLSKPIQSSMVRMGLIVTMSVQKAIGTFAKRFYSLLLQKDKRRSILSVPKTVLYRWLLFRSVISTLRFAVEWFSDCILGVLFWGKSETLPPIHNPLLLESASSLANKIRSRQVSSLEVIEAYIVRIKEVNPILNAVICECFENAIEEAKRVDEYIASSGKTAEELKTETPFLGVPYTLKGSYQAKGLHFSVGNVLRTNVLADRDADVTRLMKKSGAILLGLTNTSEMCLSYDCRNMVHGITKNPYNTTKTPGGSSGGEGSIVAAAGSVIGIGSDMGGSVRIPAFFNGLFGHKPTAELVSVDGHFPDGIEKLSNLVCVGPLCRYASDLRPLMKVLAEPQLSLVQLDKQADLKKLKIYYMEDFGLNAPQFTPAHPEIKKAQQMVLSYFQKSYGIQVEEVHLSAMKDAIQIWSHKFSATSEAAGFSVQKVMTNNQGEANRFWELLKYFVGASNHTFPVLGLSLLQMFFGTHSNSYEHYTKEDAKLQQKFQDLLGDDGVFLFPTFPLPSLYTYQSDILIYNLFYGAIFNALGLPATHCPIHLTEDGFNVGIQVVGAKYQDHLCISVAEELERVFGGWRSPCEIKA